MLASWILKDFTHADLVPLSLRIEHPKRIPPSYHVRQFECITHFVI